jgi:hypothetical protein
MQKPLQQIPEEMGIRRIMLTQCYFAYVDADQFDALNQVPWCVLRSRDGRRQYAMRRANNRYLLMHRVITNAPPGMDVDHINGNGLDNRRTGASNWLGPTAAMAGLLISH